MTGASTASYAALLQIKYLPGLVRQFNDDYPLLKYIRQDSDSVDAEGEKAKIALELGLNEGGGFHGESADVAQSGYGRFKTVEVTLKQMTFRSRITYRLMRKAKTTAASFARGASQQMQATREAFTLTANQYLWGDGTGCMARVKSHTLGTNDKIKFYKAYGLDDGGAPEAIIRAGQVLHILDTRTYTSGVSTDYGYGTVKSVDDFTGTAGEIEVTLESGYTLSTGVGTGAYVFLQNTIQGWTDPGESEDNRPTMGMVGFYDSDVVDTLQGLSPTVTVGSQAAEPQWKPRKVDIATSADTFRTFRQAKNLLSKKVREGRLAYIISSYEAHESWASVYDQKVEFRNVTKIDGAWDVATYDGRPWFLDQTAPKSRAFMVPFGMQISRYAVDDFINLVDQGGGPMMQVPNKTVFDTFITATYEYGIKRRNTLISVTGLDF